VSALDRAIRAARDPAPPEVEPGWKLETELYPDGRARPIGTAYLRNGACPLACVYCALYRGAATSPAEGVEIARQIRRARAHLGPVPGLKLYNASSLFEPASVAQDRGSLRAVAEAVEDLDLVVAEARSENAAGALDLAPRLRGRLEIAIGLEVADDELLRRLNKPTSVANFRRSAELLLGAGISLRAFVLVGTPLVPAEEVAQLALRTFEVAREAGARVISFLPVVSMHSPMERLRRAGLYGEVPIETFFEVVAAARGRGPVVLAETESLDRLPGCTACRTARASALETLNATGELPGVACPDHRPPAPAAVRRASESDVVAALSAP
jgi:uncharacterized Fe-S cluster-containing MiaB family protein